MIKCNECSIELPAPNALGYHLRTHNMTYPDYIVKHQYNGVWPTCYCGKKLEYRKGGFFKFCSKSCASAGENNAMHGKKGEKCPSFGLKRTEEQKKNYSEGSKKRWEIHGDKLREMMKTEKYRKANSEGQKQSYIKNPSLKKLRSDSVNLFWKTSPLANKLRMEASERAIKLLNENIIGPQAPFKRTTLINPWTNEEEQMHSSWETSFFQTCIDKQYKITKNHGIIIQYTHPDGSLRNYIPDFFSEKDKTLYEMKGRYDEVDLAKWKSAESFCKKIGLKFIVLFSPFDYPSDNED